MPPKIANIVAVADLGNAIILSDLSDKIPGEFSYNPAKFKAAILKISYPFKSTFLIWSSGKIVCLGLKNLEECEQTIKYLVEHIKYDICSSVFYSGYYVENIVTSFNFGKEINLNAFRSLRPKSSFYEPEIFCGLNYKRGDRLTALIFYTGKIVITGGKNLEEINEMYYHILPYLKLSSK